MIYYWYFDNINSNRGNNYFQNVFNINCKKKDKFINIKDDIFLIVETDLNK